MTHTEMNEAVALRLGWQQVMNGAESHWHTPDYKRGMICHNDTTLPPWSTDDGLAIQLHSVIQRYTEGFTISWLSEYGYGFSCRLKGQTFWSNPLFQKLSKEEAQSLAIVSCLAFIALVPLEEDP